MNKYLAALLCLTGAFLAAGGLSWLFQDPRIEPERAPCSEKREVRIR
jgi:hypothetical protein